MQYLIEIIQHTNSGPVPHEIRGWLDDLIPFPDQINKVEHNITRCIYWYKNKRNSISPNREQVLKVLNEWETQFRKVHFIPDHEVSFHTENIFNQQSKNFNPNQTELFKVA